MKSSESFILAALYKNNITNIDKLQKLKIYMYETKYFFGVIQPTVEWNHAISNAKRKD